MFWKLLDHVLGQWERTCVEWKTKVEVRKRRAEIPRRVGRGLTMKIKGLMSSSTLG